MTSQFTERKSKAEAIKAHGQKKSRTAAELFPAGKCNQYTNDSSKVCLYSEQIHAYICLFTVAEQQVLQKEIAAAKAKSKTKKRKSPTCKTCGKHKKGDPRGTCTSIYLVYQLNLGHVMK